MDEDLLKNILLRHGLILSEEPVHNRFSYRSWYKSFDDFVKDPELWKRSKHHYANSEYLPFWLDLSFSSSDAEHIKHMFLEMIGCQDPDTSLKQAITLVQLLGAPDKNAC